MADFNRDLDLSDVIIELARRVTELEVAALATLTARVAALEVPAITLMAPAYTDGGRPPIGPSEGGIIYNTTTFRHQGSDGLNWNDLYIP